MKTKPKTYRYKNELIYSNELIEIILPKPGDRLRLIKEMHFWGFEVGDVIIVTEIYRNLIVCGNEIFSFTYLEEYFELVPPQPVCPPELLPMPYGAVYLG